MKLLDHRTEEDPVDELSIDPGEDDSVTSEPSRDELKEMKKIVEQESRTIGFWRLIVCLGIVVVGAAVTWMTYVFLSNDETKNFEKAFDQYATSVIEVTNFNADAISESYGTFADYITSFTIETNATWPMFTVPDLDVHGQNLLDQTKSLAFLISHEVQPEERRAWETYTRDNGDWIGQPFAPVIHDYDDQGNIDPVNIGPGPWGPIWEMYPPPIWAVMNNDLRPQQINLPVIKKLKHAIFGRLATQDSGILRIFKDEIGRAPGEPFSTYFVPLYDTFQKEHLVGTMTGFLVWGRFFRNLLPPGVSDIDLVLDSGDCGEHFTWRLDGTNATFMGEGDLHETKFDKYKFSTLFGVYADTQAVVESGVCLFSVSVYPSSSFESTFETSKPAYLSAVVGSVFLLVIVAFFSFDYFQTKRNDKVLKSAAKTSSVVTSMFPTEFRDRLMQNTETQNAKNEQSKTKKSVYFASQDQRIKHFLKDGDEEDDDRVFGRSTKAIADFYPDVTVMFADIVGFTAWCSSREPSQVFDLLESTYATYDTLVKRRRVFKVETVGDCYVAAAGLPEKRKDHALIMARFAHVCLHATSKHFKRLEKKLGPDTSELSIRIGLHSGPVTAGVLRGERARFQLFGDTMNVASRIESAGVAGRIHISAQTASLLKTAGKQHWIKPVQAAIDIKGKGKMQTYFLAVTNDNRSSVADESGEDGTGGFYDDETAEITAKQGRLIDWHVDVFSGLLKQIACHRRAVEKTSGSKTKPAVPTSTQSCVADEGKTCLDEVKEIIELPKLSKATAEYLQDNGDSDSFELDPIVVDELRAYIRTISMLYHKAQFHNFEHASHVTMSVRKLLSRIVMPSNMMYEVLSDDGDDSGGKNNDSMRQEIASSLHDHTYGVTSDPLTQFAVIFSALIHDVDHLGIPNTQLVKEKPELAAVYKGKSVAEQNSIVLSWDLLMDDSYANLRTAIYSNEEEKSRFRQLVVQTVLATDIVDPELKALRNSRWATAFSESYTDADPQDTINRKATIVIEHLIQASDVSHTMQHWHVYRKWNECFFQECYQAYFDGRAEKDPSEGWYKGEIGFFDYYIIPLAKKLKDCGVFGVSSDEYLNYALQNREEWVLRGQQVVAEMLEKFAAQSSGSIAAV